MRERTIPTERCDAVLTHTMLTKRASRVTEHHEPHDLASWGSSEISNLSHREWLIDLRLPFFHVPAHCNTVGDSHRPPARISSLANVQSDLWRLWGIGRTKWGEETVFRYLGLCRYYYLPPSVVHILSCGPKHHKQKFTSGCMTDETRRIFDLLSVLNNTWPCLLQSHDNSCSNSSSNNNNNKNYYYDDDNKNKIILLSISTILDGGPNLKVKVTRK
jgi:hypothetical protein